jgi:hypothetical protein
VKLTANRGNMVTLKAQIIKKNGEKEFAVLPYKEFVEIQEKLDDYECLRCLRECKESACAEPNISMEDLKKRLKGSGKKKK